ncbi:MAG: acyltransferase family protein [Gemmatirosa sp.]
MVEPRTRTESGPGLHTPRDAFAYDRRSPAPATPSHIPALDGLRGIAVLLVLVNNLYPGEPRTFVDGMLYLVTNTGWTGVDLFFVLSGFLITGILLDTQGAPGHFRAFYARRLLRIFPLYYGFLLLLFVVLPAVVPLPADDLRIARSAQGWYWSYLGNVRLAFGAPIARLEPGLFWSLAVEEQFYLAWPLVVWAAGRRRLVQLCVAMLAVSLALRVGWRLVDGSRQAMNAIYVLTPTRWDGLAVGALLAVAARSPTAWPTVARRAWPVAGAALALLAATFVVRKGLLAHDVVVQTVGYSAVAVAAGAVLAGAVAARPGTRVARLFGHPALRVFGRYSYGIYVYQGLVRYWLWHHVPFVMTLPLVAGLQAPAAALVLVGASALTTAVAVVSYHVLERPFLRLKDRVPYGMPARRRSRT